MSEKDKKILETITKAIPTMSEFDKGYMLGLGEALAQKREEERKKEARECTTF